MVGLLRYRVLGPIEVSTERGVLRLGGPKQRLVLGMLLANAGRPVAEDRLIDGVWGDDPPDQARHALQTYVSELRTLLDDEIRHEGRAYRLVVDPELVDAHRFESLIQAARARLADAPAGAAALLREALALWRGEPYADVAAAPGLLPDIGRLQQTRLGAVEDRVRADLDCGRHAYVVAELEALTREHSFREHLHGLHMLALYRSGRQADALRVYERAREVLAQELGIDPSPELQSLRRRILAQDPDLLPSGVPPGAPPMPTMAGPLESGEAAPVGFHVVRAFELRERVGEGDFGTVYRAYQASVGREVAVKVIREEYANTPAFVREFEPRARRIAELDHPNVVPLLDSWRDPKGAYLITPWVRGGSVRRALRHGPWSLPATLRMLEQVGTALASAHRHGALHGDVKAANVLLDGEGNALLTDFSMTRRGADAAGAPRTTAAASLSPEERRGQLLSPASDVYGLGVLAVETLTGTHPPVEQPAARLATVRPDLPAAIQAVLARATAPEPGKRHQRIEDLLRDLRQAAGADVVALPLLEEEPAGPIRNPYKGLRAFGESDALDFFGRELLVDRLVEVVRARRLVAVVGPGGSGKSSVVRAGLIPALRAGAVLGSRDWLITDMFPGSYPFEEMEAALLRIAVERPEDLLGDLKADDRGMLRAIKQILPNDDSELVLVIDQFEELFSLTTDPDIRRLFMDGLVTLARDARGRVRAVLTLRADFFDRRLEHHAFGELVRAGLVPVTVPSPEELAQAISRPAQQLGVDYEPGLAGGIVRDVAGQPGGLPLLQHALTELFARREGRMLTAEAYRATGGVLGALGRRAEELYRSLSPGDRRVSQQVLLRLVSVGEHSEDARRRVRRSELAALEADPEAVDHVIRQFGAHRLLSFDRDPVTRGPTVEIAHEALFREWRRLRGWIDSQREDLLLHRRLTSAAVEWREAERPDDYLLSDGRLEQYEGWVSRTDLMLTVEEGDYLGASRDRENRLSARRRRRRRGIIGGSIGASVVALVLASIALLARNEAHRERLTAQRQATVADARRLASQSLAEGRLDRSLLLALAAVHLDDSLESRRALLTSLARSPAAIGVLRGAGQSLQNMVITPDGGMLAVGDSNGSITFFDTRSRQRIGEPVEVGGAIQPGALALSPDGGSLAVGVGGEGDKRSFLDLIDVRTRSVEFHEVLNEAVFPETVAFSPTEELVAVATRGYDEGADPFAKPQRKSVLLFDTTSGERVGELMLRPSEYRRGGLIALVFSPDGEMMMGSSEGATTILWDLRSMSRVRTFDLAGAPAVSVDGRTAAIGDEDGSIHLLDLHTGEQREMRGGQTSLVTALAFSPDGESLASTSFDRTVMLWDVASREPRETFEGHAGGVRAVVFSPDGQTLYTSGDDGTIIVWDRGGARRLARRFDRGEGTPTWSQIFALSPQGNIVAIPEADGTIRLWDLAELRVIEELPPYKDGPIWGLAFSPDGRTLATTGADGTVALRDVETGSVSSELRPSPRPTGGGWWTTFSPDGSMLAATFGPDPTGLRTTVIVWELESRRSLRELHLRGGAWVVEFSPDGRFLSAATCCYTTATSEVAVWEVGTWRKVLSPNIGELAGQTDFSPDGGVLAVGDFAGRIRFWNVGSGRQAGPAITGLDAEVTGVDISPDGKTLVASLSDGRVLLWDLPSRERIGQALASTEAGVARFTPDGMHLVAVQAVGSAFVWDLDPASWKRHACLVAGRNLTAVEWREFLPARPYEQLCTR